MSLQKKESGLHRLFIAVPLPDSIQTILLEQMNLWKKQGMKGRFVSGSSLHLTLAFLGEQPESAIRKAEEILEKIPFPKVSLTMEGTGSFHSLLYADLHAESDSLETYVRRLRSSLLQAGIQPDNKPFRPHITLCRRMEKPDFLDPVLKPEVFSLPGCCLYESKLLPSGPLYTVLKTVEPA